MTQLLANAFSIPLEPEDFRSVVDDTPVDTGAGFVTEFAGASVGVWSADVGHIGGETTDEIFVILEGRAEITFEDTGETITAGPGDIVRLNAGQRNSWKTLEKLRKVSFYVPAAS
ncbi:cupin domain-containing protein [Gordonia sp. Z-3]|uniref:cupin domain-containing protein n=1 Tax=Gordonia sp. Z-3 TaxID=3115408 RepID=UPI002E2B3CB0|nr:cupin domain-containing protein [Gordonia sp. Z-3]MED5803842.1 cupin domain-containing protein [Gordonia sp. Z-3]